LTTSWQREFIWWVVSTDKKKHEIRDDSSRILFLTASRLGSETN
jgi:hypothetical protein